MVQDIRLSRESRQALLQELGLEVRRHQNAQDQFDEAACAYLGINRSDGRALDIVDQHGRITAGQLATESGLSSGAITTLLDRLERAGYVRRARDEQDRRKVYVELTELARQRSGEIWGPMGQSADELFGRHTDAELLLIRDFLREGREFLAQHLERVRAMGAAPFDDASPPGRSR